MLQTLRQIADRQPGESTVAAIATAWVVSRPAVGVVILGARNSHHLESTHAAVAMTLTEQDFSEIDTVLAQSKGPSGEVYGLERTPAHGGVMRYNLNHIGTQMHLIELIRRAIRRHIPNSSSTDFPIVTASKEELEALGLLHSEVDAASGGLMLPRHDQQVNCERLLAELDCVGRPEVLCCTQPTELDPSERIDTFGWLLMALTRLHLELELGQRDAAGPNLHHFLIWLASCRYRIFSLSDFLSLAQLILFCHWHNLFLCVL